MNLSSRVPILVFAYCCFASIILVIFSVFDLIASEANAA